MKSLFSTVAAQFTRTSKPAGQPVVLAKADLTRVGGGLPRETWSVAMRSALPRETW